MKTSTIVIGLGAFFAGVVSYVASQTKGPSASPVPVGSITVMYPRKGESWRFTLLASAPIDSTTAAMVEAAYRSLAPSAGFTVNTFNVSSPNVVSDVTFNQDTSVNVGQGLTLPSFMGTPITLTLKEAEKLS